MFDPVMSRTLPVWIPRKQAYGQQSRGVVTLSAVARVVQQAQRLSVVEKQRLPGVCFSGTFPDNRRRRDALIRHTGLLLVDYDHLETPHSLAGMLSRHPSVALVYVTRSGEGVRAVFRVDREIEDAEEHRRVWDAFYDYCAARWGESDRAVCDVSRLSYLAYDPFVYYNPECEPLLLTVRPAESEMPSVTWPPPSGVQPDFGKASMAEVEGALDALWADAADYHSWLSRGMQLHAWDSVIGLPLWERWSQRVPHVYRAGACEEKWGSFRGDRGLTEASLFADAMERGWRRNG